MKILIKAMRPHRQKILTEGGEEMRLQQWANKQAASALREAGGDAGGEQFNQARDALMHSAVNNPEEHGLKFMGERVPFDGQELEESLSAPDVEGERASIDETFSGSGTKDDPFVTDNRDETERAMSGGKPKTPDIFDEEGKLRDGIEPEEEKEEFEPDKEAEHLRRIMTSRQVPMRDAWSILKADWNPNTQSSEGEPYNKWGQEEVKTIPLGEGQDYRHIKKCKRCQAVYKPKTYDMGLCPECDSSSGTVTTLNTPPYQDGPTEPDWGTEAYK